MAKAEKNSWKKPTENSLNEILNADVFDTVKYVILSFRGTFTEPCLGTVPKNEDVHTRHVAKDDGTESRKAQITEETETIDNKGLTDKEKQGYTGFWKDDDGIFVYNYWILGNIKANIETLVNNGAIKKIWKMKHFVDKTAQVFPRRIHFLGKPEADETVEDSNGLFKLNEASYTLERPLRADTMKGERVTVAKSDVVDVGTQFDFNIKLIYNDKGLTPEVITRAIKLGERYGLGQWRGSGGYGRYTVELLKAEQIN